jgi:uncharacterized repeat protein (TIGR01451 family)
VICDSIAVTTSSWVAGLTSEVSAMRTLTLILVLLVESLVSASTLNFNYDAAGRLVSVNYGGSTNTAFSYDNNGNLLSQSTFVSANPDLAIAQAAAPASVMVGTLLQYAVTVFNNSTSSATTVKLTNTLPANVTFVTSAVTLGSVVRNGSILSWTVGTLTNAAAAMLTFTVRPTVIGILTNIAIVSAAQADPYSADNTNKLTTTVVAPPQAGANFSEGSVSINWPIIGGDGFSVQYSDSLSPPVVWKPVTAPVTVDGYGFYIEEPPTNTHRFYRLVAP